MIIIFIIVIVVIVFITTERLFFSKVSLSGAPILGLRKTTFYPASSLCHHDKHDDRHHFQY